MGPGWYPWGPPRELAYDFAAAAEFRAQAEWLAHRLALLGDVHLEHVQDARRHFEGATRQRFERRFELLVGELQLVVAGLRGQAADLDDELDRAHAAQARRADAIEEWQRAQRRSRDAGQTPRG